MEPFPAVRPAELSQSPGPILLANHPLETAVDATRVAGQEGAHVKLYVGNLSFDTTDAQLKDLAKAFGTPSSAEVVKDKMTGQARGFGFVEFPTDAEGNAAIAGLNGKEVNGRTLKVNEARSKGAR